MSPDTRAFDDDPVLLGRALAVITRIFGRVTLVATRKPLVRTNGLRPCRACDRSTAVADDFGPVHTNCR